MKKYETGDVIYIMLLTGDPAYVFVSQVSLVQFAVGPLQVTRVNLKRASEIPRNSLSEFRELPTYKSLNSAC